MELSSSQKVLDLLRRSKRSWIGRGSENSDNEKQVRGLASQHRAFPKLVAKWEQTSLRKTEPTILGHFLWLL
jgi:hypothetical protein